jgi:hypothetical protein
VLLLLALLTLSAHGAPWALAMTQKPDRGPRARLTATFNPKRLGGPTTMSFAVAIEPPAQGVPVPVSQIEVGYPDNFGLATSGLGLAACDPSALETLGGEACPANSKMGEGSALVEVPFGPVPVPEAVALAFYAAPSNDGRLHLAIWVHAKTPVYASLVVGGVLLPGRLQMTVPPIVGVAGGPDVSLVSMRASIGGALTYYQFVRGKRVAYRPRGIGLPDSCPRGGWRIAASFVFVDATHSSAQTAVSCPADRRVGG